MPSFAHFIKAFDKISDYFFRTIGQFERKFKNVNGERVFDYSCGFSDAFLGKKMNGDELFNLYSCSKITTVTAALQLLEKGIFLLDDPVCEYIPEYRKMYVKDENGNSIEITNDMIEREELV